MHRAHLCAVRSGQRSAQHTQDATALCVCTGQQRRKRPAEPTSPETDDSCTGANNVAQSKLAAWAEERKGRGAQRERHTAAAAVRTATTASSCVDACSGAPGKPARDLAPAQGVVLPSSADSSLSPAVLAPCMSSQSGNVARARSEENAVRSEQATCAVANHVRRTAGIFGPCSGAQRCAAPHPSVCGATRGAVRARRRSRGRSRGQCTRSCQGAAVELPQWRALLRPAAQRAVYHRDAHMPRSSARGATSGAARARRRSFAHAAAGGWAGHRWAAALVSTSSARA